MTNISANTQAILMLVSPLIAGGSTERKLLLTHREYTNLVKTLQQLDSQPADLIDREKVSDILKSLEKHQFDQERLSRLLGRGMQLGLALEHWQQRSIQVISRADDLYPQRLKKTLQHQAPALLYVCGDIDLLNSGGLAVVGSRHVDADLLNYACCVGEIAAGADCTIVSGGAKGIDQAAMQGAVAAGGSVIGVVANSLETAVIRSRNELMNNRLLLCSPFDPAVRFQVWQAMDRNKLIYAFSDAALVVESDMGKGGTWQGAVEQIQKLKVVPLYTRMSGPDSAGLKELRKLGAQGWPEFDNAEKLREFMQANRELDNDTKLPLFSQPIAAETDSPVEIVTQPSAEVLADSPDRPDALTVAEPGTDSDSYGSPTPLPNGQEKTRQAQDLTWKDKLFQHVEEIILQILKEQGPLTRDEVAVHLDTAKGQTGSWLKNLVDSDKVEKLPKSTRFQIKKGEQLSFSRPRDESAGSSISPDAEQ